eukprot:gb/GEZN01002575.1/.p1 GENE.gb/GEZN01002575.1/~~gb/GEZN01002575.1/.p1  ORF type:complete len:623 (+),score=99.18 gb/GEZN01002575.1/:56-1924(+)
MSGIDYVALDEHANALSALLHPQRILNPVMGALGMVGLGLVGLAGYTADRMLDFSSPAPRKPFSRNSRTTVREGPPPAAKPFWPSDDLEDVVVKPGAPVAGLALLAPDDTTGCLFTYASLKEHDEQDEEFAEGSTVEDAWLYGAKLNHNGPFAYATGNTTDIVKGRVLCWPAETFEDKLEEVYIFRKFDPDQPQEGSIRCSIAPVVLRDGSSTDAVWFHQTPESIVPKQKKKTNTPKIAESFEDFHLLGSLLYTLKNQSLTVPTEVQQRAIPLLMAKRSIVALAETGSGKTLAYVLPVLHMIKTLDDTTPVTSDSSPRAVIVVPTRELGEQITKVFKIYTHDTRVRVRSVLGGTNMATAKRNVAGPFEILVATPGRIISLLSTRQLNLWDVKILILDEADQMVDEGFIADTKRVISKCPGKTQLALFSATVPESIATVIEDLFSNAMMIKTKGAYRVVPTLKTYNQKVKDGKRWPLLDNLLREKIDGSVIIFTNTREQCDKVVRDLENSGREVVYYRGEMDKAERKTNLKMFKDGEVNLLVSTDLASRGLDIPDVGVIVNYHLPQDMDNYLHRVGRTARAGREGIVVNFVTERDEDLVARLGEIAALPTKPPKKSDTTKPPN